ncbi:hypothetical protein RSAG8_06676, partial [Rhizoctonia solani AG-8 WAC10335]
MSNQPGQQHHVQHPHLGNMFPNGANAHMNPGMHGALGFPGAYNTQMGFHAPQPPQQAYANMAMMGMGAQNAQAQQARLHLQQLQARQVQVRAHAQAQAAQAQQAQAQHAHAQAQAQAQAQVQAQAQTQAQPQLQQRPQNQAMGNNGAGPSTNPTQTGASAETTPDQLAASHAKLAGLLALTEHAGPAQSLAVTAAVAPHLPQILALAKSGQLNAQQLNQLKTLVAMVAKHNGKPIPNQLQRSAQGSPQVQ